MAGAKSFTLIGDSLCLDLANTLEWRGTERKTDWLTDYADLLAWAQHAGALEPRLTQRLREQAAKRPVKAKAVHRQAHDLRAAIYRVVSALANGKRAPKPALEELNAKVFWLIGQTRLGSSRIGLARAWAGTPNALERVLWPIAWSTFELLSGNDVSRVRECANNDCHWLFLDRSRNRSRRWCAMRNCGNIVKARRYRRRHA